VAEEDLRWREGTDDVEVSVVMPCLNEERTIGACIQKALHSFDACGIKGEVIVSDNGSTDRSAEIAREHGVRLVHQPLRGYGHAYLKGLEAARGRYIVMADSDGTYDFGEIPRLLTPLREGWDLVIGSRIKGKILPGAMPWMHRYIGTPVLTALLNLFFGLRLSDINCGMRAFTRDAYTRMRLQSGGMEFASEMMARAARERLRIVEMPIAYHPRVGESKLQSLSDGWRHLRFMLLYSPTHLFLAPGGILLALGLLLLALPSPGRFYIGSVSLDIHSMILGSMLAILGAQVVTLGLYAKIFAWSHELESPPSWARWVRRSVSLERGLLVGAALVLLGSMLFGFIVYIWWISGLSLEDRMQLRTAVWGLTLMVLGVQIIFASFFVSVLGMGEQSAIDPSRHAN
jgi:glycosyltransferase involved in cell wall biosynthesis